MKFSPLFPPSLTIQDERVTYKKMLEEAKKRQAERDEIAEALIDNAFHGVPYKSLAMEVFGREVTIEELKWWAAGRGKRVILSSENF